MGSAAAVSPVDTEIYPRVDVESPQSWAGGGGSTAAYRHYNQNIIYEDTVASASASGGRGMPASSSKTRQHTAYLDTSTPITTPMLKLLIKKIWIV
jgi:hypothetical protein